MIDRIEDGIVEEAKRRLSRFSKDSYLTHRYRKTFTKRTGVAASGPPLGTPEQWSFHPHFDPRYCIKHSRHLAKGIWRSLWQGSYQPVTAYRVNVPKPDGSLRAIDIFSVPDAAIARIFLRSLRTRNEKIFSDASYAYQLHKTHLDAILRLRTLLSRDETIFISQYDFEKFFDSIDHTYLETQLSSDGPFLTTKMERNLLDSVMRHRFSVDGGPPETRSTGIPQGNSLSLFLANVAAHELDVQLGQLNGASARFADDSILVNTSYEDALSSAGAYERYSSRSGIAINVKKSPGVSILANRPVEMRHADSFAFLSYSFSEDSLRASEKAVSRIKARCSKIIYNHLLLHPRRVKKIASSRVGHGFVDWDLVTCLNELRAYVYGKRTQREINDYLENKIKINRLIGPASYFCLVSKGDQFRELDGWLIFAIQKAYAERRRLALANGLPTPAPITTSQILDGSWYSFPKIPQETRPPSFFLAWRAGRKSWSHHGLSGVDSQGGGYGY